MKLKALAAAVAFCMAGTANAAIDRFDSGDGELFFSIRDNTNNVSYTLDLNINLSEFLPGADSAQTFAADGLLTNFLNTGSGNYNWAVMAGDATGGQAVGDIRYLTTTNDSLNVGGNTNAELQAFSLMDTSYLVNVNNAMGANNSVVVPIGQPAYFNPSFDVWANNSAFNATAGIGESLDFWLLTNSGNLTLSPQRARAVNVASYAGEWFLDTDGTLTYSYATTVVPLPPAVWLLGSALVGLVGVARRRLSNSDDAVVTA